MDDSDSLTLHRVFRHSVGKVFAAWESAELMSRWFSADGWTATVTSDFRVGGGYRIQMSDGAGGSHVQFGDYLDIEPNARLRFTWTCHEIGVEGSVVTVVLARHPEGTEMTLTHELPRDPQIIGMHSQGWIRCLGGLEELLKTLHSTSTEE